MKDGTIGLFFVVLVCTFLISSRFVEEIITMLIIALTAASVLTVCAHVMVGGKKK